MNPSNWNDKSISTFLKVCNRDIGDDLQIDHFELAFVRKVSGHSQTFWEDEVDFADRWVHGHIPHRPTRELNTILETYWWRNIDKRRQASRSSCKRTSSYWFVNTDWKCILTLDILYRVSGTGDHKLWSTVSYFRSSNLPKCTSKECPSLSFPL